MFPQRTKQRASPRDLILRALTYDLVDVRPVSRCPIRRVRAYGPRYLTGDPMRKTARRRLGVDLAHTLKF